MDTAFWAVAFLHNHSGWGKEGKKNYDTRIWTSFVIRRQSRTLPLPEAILTEMCKGQDEITMSCCSWNEMAMGALDSCAKVFTI